MDADARWAYIEALRALIWIAQVEVNRTNTGNPPAGIYLAFSGADDSLEEAWVRVRESWDALQLSLGPDE